MAEQTAPETPESAPKFVNSPTARLLAIALAVGVGALGYVIYSDTLTREAAIDNTANADALKTLEVSDEVRACIDKRTGDIDALVADGLMTEEAAALSRDRAIALCYKRPD